MHNNCNSDWNSEHNAGGWAAQNNAYCETCRGSRMSGSSARKYVNRCGNLCRSSDRNRTSRHVNLAARHVKRASRQEPQRKTASRAASFMIIAAVINGCRRGAKVGGPAKLGGIGYAQPSYHGMAPSIGPTPIRTFSDYTFWPYAYDDSYWAYVYDDFVDGIFFPYGAPYLGDANGGPYATYNGPYDTGGSISVGSRAERIAPIGSVSTAARQLCEDPGTGVTAWPIDQIIETVQPNEEQRTLLDDLKNAAVRAADAFRNACPTAVPMTPVSRLQAMIGRLEATLDAITVVRPMLEKFYDSLSDEQKAKFNAMEADVEEQAPETRQPTNACANAKPGLADLPIDRIDEVVRPTGDQEDALDRLSNSTQKAVRTLRAACPHSTPLTPVGRLEVMEQRLNAILTAAKTIQPALEDFYGSLNNEQKARFNTLDRSFARGA